jgi:hypothetical protein
MGFANFAIRLLPRDKAPPLYALMISGTFDLPGAEGKEKVVTAFRINAELENAERWNSFDIETTNASSNTIANASWKRGDAFPDIEVKRDGHVVMNTEMAQAFIALQGGSPGGEMEWLSQLSDSRASGMVDAMALQAREGTMDLAGRQRRCYIMSAGLPTLYQVKVYFTEVGEVARIELPQDYRLLEPMMHGLEPELKTVE